FATIRGAFRCRARTSLRRVCPGRLAGWHGEALRLDAIAAATDGSDVATTDSFRWAHAAKRRGGGAAVASLGGRRLQRRRSHRSRRQAAQGNQERHENRRVHPRGAQCRWVILEPLTW